MKMCPGCGTPTKCKAAKKCLGPKVVKKKSGGGLKPPPNPGAAALPTSVRNNMGFKKYGGSIKKMKGGGKCMVDGIAMQGKTKIKRTRNA